MRANGVMCYWKYDPDGKYRRCWVLAESFAINNDGYPIGERSTKDWPDTRHEWNGWMNTRTEGEDYDLEPIMGRAVTVFQFESGCTLLDLHPPEWPPWLSGSFVEEIRKLPNWSQFLEGGFDLYLGTARAAEKIIFQDAPGKLLGRMAGYCQLCRSKELELYGTVLGMADERHALACKAAGCQHPTHYD